MKPRSAVQLGLPLVLAASVIALAAGQSKVEPRSAEHAFVAGARVWMDLSGGDYRIRAGRDDRVWVEWTTDDPDDIAGIKTTLQRSGSDLTLSTRGPRGGMRVIVEVPARSDLTVRLSAGNLRVEGVTGNKDLSSWAGNVVVDVGSVGDYRQVDASVTAGDIDGGPFEGKKGGLFRSLSWQGSGPYSIKVRLTAGDITFR